MLGKQIGWPYSTPHSFVVRISPSCTSEMSVLVPPMSRPMAFSNPLSPAMCRQAMAPAAIPEAAIRPAKRRTSLPVMTPPPECRIRRSPSYPPSSRRCSRRST